MKADIIIATGGTGGHIFPAIAIAKALQALRPELTIHFVGAKGGMEERLVPQAGYGLAGLPIRGLRRKLSPGNVLKNLLLPVNVLHSYLMARKLIGSTGAKLVVGTGGYASFPALLAAYTNRIPYVLNEQNAYPGLVNRRFANGATRVYLGMAEAEGYLPKAQTLHTGNPVRPEFAVALAPTYQQTARAKYGLATDGKVVFITGGSLGARALNSAMAAGLTQLAEAGVHILWQCGRVYYQRLQHLGERPGVQLLAFVDDMPSVYAASDLVISRAGALTIAELQYLQKPSILVPSPNVAEDHQTKNAIALARHGGAVVVPEADVTTQLIPMALSLLASPDKLDEMAQALASDRKADAAEVISQDILGILDKQK